MKTLIIFIFLCCVIGLAHAQVGINTTNPNAVLEVKASNAATPSNTDGLLIPKVDNFPAINPTAAQHGMLVFATGGGTPTMGFYYWQSNSSSWVKLSTGLDTEWIDNGTYLSPVDGYTKDVAIGGTNWLSTKLTVKSLANHTIAHFSNEYVPAPLLAPIIRGLFTEIGTATPILDNVTTYLNHNKLSQSDGNLYGEYNELTALIDGFGSNPDSIVGNYNKIRGISSAYIGNLNDIVSGYETYGIHNKLLVGNNGGNRIGVKNEITGSLGANFHIGVENILKGNSYSERYGTKNLIIEGNASNSLNAYGSYNLIESLGTGDKFGSFDSIPHTVPGKHYGVYSSATKVGSYAGYFLGNVAVGTYSGDTYIFPSSRGTNGQIIKTDGSGNLYWANETVGDHDFYQVGSTSAPTSISDNIFTNGFVGINNNNPNYSLDVFNSRGTRSINIQIDDFTAAVTTTDSYGIKTNIANINSGLSTGTSFGLDNTISVLNDGYGVQNTITGPLGASGNLYGTSNSITNSGSGNSYATYNVINNTVGSGNQYASYNVVNGVGTGIYSQAISAGGVAAYFLGTVSIGTNNANTYNLPASRGTNGQIMQTDGAGNVTWVSGIVDHDFYEVGTTSSPSTINDNIFTQGNVGIGIANPQERLDVGGTIKLTTTATNAAIIKNDDNFNHTTDNNLDFGNDLDSWTLSSREGTTESSGIHGDGDFVTIWSPADSNRMLRLLDEDAWGDNDGNPYNNSAEIAYVDAAGQFVQASDRNRKEDIQKINQALLKINEINGYTYKFKDKSGKETVNKITSGVIAQELYEVLPEAVQKNENGEYFVHYAGIIPLLIEGIKEQQEEIKLLKKEIEYLKQLEQRLKALEQKIDN